MSQADETILTPEQPQDTARRRTANRQADRTPDASPTASSAPPRERDPYPGLRPFRSDESDIFFGRERQTDEMVQRLKTSRFLAVIGTSGCGKSSLVRAGLIAALETGLMGVPEGARWQFAVMRPGGRPMQGLAAKLFAQAAVAPNGGGRDIGLGLLGARLRRGPLGLVEALRASPLPDKTNLLVVVDQFEEIFRFRREDDINEADAFVALLLASAEQPEFPVYVVLTMRSDFIGECALFEGLPEAINESQYLTPRLSREQRRLAIVGPARSCGGDVHEVLVNRLLNETGGGPDQLPVLQHLLMRMWTSKVREVSPGQPIELTLDDYDRVGGLQQALSRHADEVYNGLASDAQRDIAEVMFRRLSESPTDIRRPTEAGEIARLASTQLEEVTKVADAFRAPGTNFLMPDPSEPIEARTKLDISHESLIKRWQRLRAWSSEEARDANSYRDLEREAQKYKQGESDPLTGLNLQRALGWRQQRVPTREWAARYGGDFDLAMTFLRISEEAANRAKDARERARRRELRLWRFAAVFFGALLLLTVTLGYVAFTKQQAVAEQRARAIASQARSALENGDSRIAMLAALDALPVQSPQLGDFAEMLRSPLDLGQYTALRAMLDQVVQSPFDGRRYIAAFEALREALRWPVDTRSFRAVRDSLFRPLQDDAVIALERGVFRPVGRIFGSADDTALVTALALNNATKMLVTSSDKGIVQRWQWGEAGWKALTPILHPPFTRSAPARPAAATRPAFFARGGAAPGFVAPTPSNSANAGSAGREKEQQQVLGAVLSADGRLLVAVTDWNQATLWEAQSGTPIVSWFANRKGTPPARPSNGAVIAFAEDPDRPGHHRILTASYVDDAVLWEWDEGMPDRQPERLLPLEDKARKRQPPGQRSHRSGVTTLAFSHDGRRIVTGSWDGTAKVWDAATGDLLYILDSGRPVRSARFSPRDSGLLVTAESDGNVRLWCTHPGTASAAQASGDKDAEQRPPTPCVPATNPPNAGAPVARVTTVGVGPLATAAKPGPRLRPAAPIVIEPKDWDALPGHGREAISAVFDPAGERIASASLDGTVRLWDATTGEIQDVMRGPAKVSGRHALVAFLDDEHIAASFSDARVFLWTVAASRLRPRLMAVPAIRTTMIDAQNRRLATVAGINADAAGMVNQIKVWNLGGAGATVMAVRELRTGAEPVSRVAFSPDGRHLLTVSGTSVALWNANVWRAAGDDAPIATLDHSDLVLDFAFDADGRRIVTGSADRTARIWDAHTGRPLAPPLVHDAPVTAVAFDGAGKRVVTAAGGTARIWDARTSSQTRALLHSATVVTAAFDATGERLATVAEDGFVRLWRVNDGSVVDTIGCLPPATGDGPVATTITMDADGYTIHIVRAPAAGVPRAWTWDIARKTLGNDDTWPISSRHRLHVRPDNGIEVMSRDNRDGPLALLPSLRHPLTGIVVSPDGGYLAALYGKGQVRVMRLPETDPQEFIRYTREKVVPLLDQPVLSREERRQLGLGG